MGMCWTKDIVQRIESAYKERKAYRYFTDNLISEVCYNNISDKLKYCYLKAKCLPSQSVSRKLYDVWVLVKKHFKYEMVGTILSAFCIAQQGYWQAGIIWQVFLLEWKQQHLLE